MKYPAIGVCLAASILSGCAGIAVEKVADDDKARGYRYYQPAPFLFVHSDGKGGLTSEIVYLPDTTKKMSARPYAALASNNATLSFSNGMLTEATAVVDQTVIPVAFLDAISKAATAAIAADIPNKPGQAPVPYLFKIIVHGATVQLSGGAASDSNGAKATINVAVTIPAGK